MWQLMGDDEMSALLKLVPAFYMCSIAYTSKTTMAQVCRCLSATWESAHDELAFMHLSSLAKIRGWMTQEECADVLGRYLDREDALLALGIRPPPPSATQFVWDDTAVSWEVFGSSFAMHVQDSS